MFRSEFDRKATKKRHKLALEYYDNWGFNIEKPSRNRSRKNSHMGCRISQCMVCHNDKFPKRELTRKEKINLLRYNEYLDE